MESILVPVDFSKQSESALKAAAKIAHKKQAEIYVLHVVEVGEPIMGTGEVRVDNVNLLFFSQLAKKKLHEFLEKDYLKGLKITDIIELGPTYHSITRNIEKFAIDLIVMGSKGIGGLEGFLLGSNTEKVVRHSAVPVLVIKNELMDVYFKKIIFTSNFEKENISSFKKAQRFSRTFNSDLKVMAINTGVDDYDTEEKLREKIKEFLKTSGTSCGSEDIIIHHAQKVEEGILEGAAENKASLIAIPTHGRSGLFQLFNGSIAEDVVNHSNIPVITFKIEN